MDIKYNVNIYHGLKMNATPMTHKQACTFKSKLTDRRGITYRLVEV